ncbi:MalY/PatB family protein [Phreatobacter sp. AB_2022a]|uniref:MalY/PatB family protein n=1 Tax=Phreatobacter sp. AB_2022a TaxID=3003134 RepID=UPI002286FD46|nr:PatB family C-S lyase [Phreatobacter sp. AB_2022a]MCZ0737840.1 PatB family C-S lyase [Phreatobacter sp. AB_2022a]
MTSVFDIPFDRKATTDCKKWHYYPDGVLPMWVADMDFAAAEPVLAAIRQRLDHPVLGYANPPDSLREAIVGALRDWHGWAVDPSALVFLPGVDPGVNMAFKAFLAPGDGVVVQTPLYRPLLNAPKHWDLQRIDVPIVPAGAGFDIDAERLKPALARARALLLCNPHNPTGRVLTRAELSFLAAECERSDLLIVSDEIHCDLVHAGARHIPIATLGPEIAARTITLMSASKTFNIPGLKTAFAIVPNPDLRKRFEAARLGMVDSNNLLGLAATEAAYRSGRPWRDQLMAYLAANLDHLEAEIAARFPAITFRRPEATFLAWLDCSALGLKPTPHAFFLDRARIGFSAGEEFGREGFGHVRMNFGTPRALLDEALARMSAGLAAIGA